MAASEAATEPDLGPCAVGASGETLLGGLLGGDPFLYGLPSLSPPGGDAQEEGDNMANIRKPTYPDRLRTILREQTNGKQYSWTMGELESFLLNWRNMKESTVKKRLGALARMAEHPVQPVQLQGTADEIVNSFYEYYVYRRDVEGKKATATMHDFRAIKSLGRLLGIPETAWPATPTPKRKPRMRLPAPEEVYHLLHADFTPDAKNSYENQLIRYLLIYDFALGIRFPSEAYALRVGDLQPDLHTILVTEPKKSDSERTLLIEPTWMCCAKNRSSLSQYLKWRAKVDVGGTDAFFLKPNGEPFRSPDDMRMWLNKRVKPRFPWYHGYLGRRWGINARLIEWDFDYARVAQWTGHESVDMIRRTYEHDARLHAKMYGDNWLTRAFYRPQRDDRTVKGSKPSDCPDAPLLADTGRTGFEPAAGGLKARCST